MDKLFLWMDEYGYRFREDLPIRLIGMFGQLSGQLSDRAKDLIAERGAEGAAQHAAQHHPGGRHAAPDGRAAARRSAWRWSGAASSATGGRCTRARCIDHLEGKRAGARTARSATSSARRERCVPQPSSDGGAGGRQAVLRAHRSSASRAGLVGDDLRHDPGAIAVGDDRRRAIEPSAAHVAGAIGLDGADLAAVVVQEAHVDRLDLRIGAAELDAAEHARQSGCGRRRRGGRACCRGRALCMRGMYVGRRCRRRC